MLRDRMIVAYSLMGVPLILIMGLTGCGSGEPTQQTVPNKEVSRFLRMLDDPELPWEADNGVYYDSLVLRGTYSSQKIRIVYHMRSQSSYHHLGQVTINDLTVEGLEPYRDLLVAACKKRAAKWDWQQITVIENAAMLRRLSELQEQERQLKAKLDR